MLNEVAERYGQGLLELAIENNTVKEKKEQAQLILQLMEENSDIALFFTAVKITKEQKKEFIETAFAKVADTDIRNLMKLLIDRGRSFYVKQVMQSYVERADEHLGILNATVTSARALHPADMKRIQEVLEKKYQKQVNLRNIVDASLIAGIKVVVGNNVTDISMKTKIEDMKQALLKGGLA